jgi:hypothetical protein
MHTLSFRLPMALLLLGFFWAGNGQALAAVSAADERKVRTVIESQLKAFADDNAPRAFAFATPALQTRFGSSEAFMAMVRSAYPVVYAPKHVVFLKVEQQQDSVIQRVTMSDADNKVWLAVYGLERQKNGSWRIGACAITESRGRFI